jgi:hypothetical protein
VSDLATAPPVDRIEWRRARHAEADTELPPPAPGTPVYHCYRYESSRHNPVYDADGTILLRLPVTERGWRANPWHQFEDRTWLSSEEALGWLGDRLRDVAWALRPTNRAASQAVMKALDDCKGALFSMQSACQTVIHLPARGTVAFAIVAAWDLTETHPLLSRGPAERRSR